MKVTAVWPVLLAFGAVLATAGPTIADDDDPSYTIEDVKACSRDAMRLCRDKLGHISEIESCMKAHYDDLRPACQARFKK